MIIAIYAKSKTNNLFGINGELPWQKYANLMGIRYDMLMFKNQTLKQDIMMGFNTWDSLHFRELPGRNKHYIVTNKDINNDDQKFNFVNEQQIRTIISPYMKHPTNHLYVIGGVRIFETLYNYFDIVYETLISLNEIKYCELSNSMKTIDLLAVPEITTEYSKIVYNNLTWDDTMKKQTILKYINTEPYENTHINISVDIFRYNK